jgi:hypothetical protein
MNWKEGLGICCWDAPSRDELALLFEGAKVPFEKMVPVEEHEEATLCT